METELETPVKMQTVAFRMNLNKGAEAEYRKRHDEIWPELSALLKEAGISEYRIFLDASSKALFAVMQCPVSFDGEALAQEPIMRKWWDHMADIMETHENNRPVAIPLDCMFYMP